MKHYAYYLILLSILIFNSCKKAEKTPITKKSTIDTLATIPIATDTVEPVVHVPHFEYDSTKWLHITDLDASIVLDIRYATDSNFTKNVIYDCPACFLRPEAAKALVRVHQNLQKKGYRLKVFDCFRPQPYQQKLWDIVPNPRYVARPWKGSMHSRGKAVDLTIINKNGKELNMGTDFDTFSPKSASKYPFQDSTVLHNRALLQNAMIEEGFQPIRSEWWHFYYGKGIGYDLSDWTWNCTTPH